MFSFVVSFFCVSLSPHVVWLLLLNSHVNVDPVLLLREEEYRKLEEEYTQRAARLAREEAALRQDQASLVVRCVLLLVDFSRVRI